MKKQAGLICLFLIIFLIVPAKAFAGSTILWGNLFSPYLNDQTLDSLAAGHVTGFNILANIQGDTSGPALDNFGNGGIGRMSPTAYQNYVNLVKTTKANAAQRGMNFIFISLFAAGGTGDSQGAITALSNQAKFTKDAGITGVLLDAEAYSGNNPWTGNCSTFFNTGRLAMQAMLLQNPNIIVILAPHFSLGIGYDCYLDFYHGMAQAGGTIVVAPEPWYNPSQGDIGTLAGQLYPQLQGNSSVGLTYWQEANPEQTISSNNTHAALFALIYTENVNLWIQRTGTSFTAAKNVLPALNALPPTQPPSQIAGSFDTASCTAIEGWTCDATHPTIPIQVDIYDGDGFSKFVGSTTANTSRPDVAAAGFCGGNASVGFSFSTPANLKDGQSHTLHAYAINPSNNGVNPEIQPAKQVSCSQTSVHGDINKDGKVDIADFLLLIQALGQQGSSADVNGDGVVNIFDFNQLLQNYGR